MLGFLRRVRRKLLDEGHLRKYLVYAVGEILLVMIGILLALQVNTWNERRTNHGLEKEFIQRLLVDIKADRASNLFTKNLMETGKKNAQKIVELWEEGRISDVDPGKLTVTVLTAAEFQFPEHNTSTYDELIASGRIGLLQNPILRTAIMRYEENNNNNNGFWDLIPKEIITRWSSKYIPPHLDERAEKECNATEVLTCAIELDNWSPSRLIEAMSGNEQVLEMFNQQIHYMHWTGVAVNMYDKRAAELEALLKEELHRW